MNSNGRHAPDANDQKLPSQASSLLNGGRITPRTKFGLLRRNPPTAVETRKYWLTQGKYRVNPERLQSPELYNQKRVGPHPIGSVMKLKVGRIGVHRQRRVEQTVFRVYYERGDLPVSVDHTVGGQRIKWQTNLIELDYKAYLPVFFDGLRELDEPYRFLAIQGTIDLIEMCPQKLVSCAPHIVIPIKTALDTHVPSIVGPVLKIMQLMMLRSPRVGQALIMYYRQILPVMALFKNKNVNVGDSIDYGQNKQVRLGELIGETLELLERTGGPDAFYNIKYMVPTYESCV